MTALALREDQTAWDDAQIAVLQASGIEKDVSPAELDAFLHECQRRRLDPFTRQIYLLGRWDNQKRRKVYRALTSIDGFRLIARRAADDAKETIEYEETIWYDADAGQHEVWLQREPPAACKVVVLRGGKRFPATATYASYVQLNKDQEPMGLWRKMADNQLAKCTEALALRKAFPEELGGIYSEEEMAQADNPNGHAVQATVIRDEPEAVTDQDWFDPALTEAATFATKARGEEMWAEMVVKSQAGHCTVEDRKNLGHRIMARIEDLAKTSPPPAVETADAEVVEGVVVDEGLDPADAWFDKVQDIQCAEDVRAAKADLKGQIASGTIAYDRGQQILAAIDVRTATLADAAVAA